MAAAPHLPDTVLSEAFERLWIIGFRERRSALRALATRLLSLSAADLYPLWHRAFERAAAGTPETATSDIDALSPVLERLGGRAAVEEICPQWNSRDTLEGALGSGLRAARQVLGRCVPVEPEGRRVQPDHVSVEQEDRRVQPDCVPVEPEDCRVQPDRVPVEPEDRQVQPDRVPVEPEDRRVQPDSGRVRAGGNRGGPDFSLVEAGRLLVLQERLALRPDPIRSDPPEPRLAAERRREGMATVAALFSPCAGVASPQRGLSA